MPKLPTAEDLGQRPTPSIRGGISRLELTTPQLGREGQALAEFGRATAGLGETMLALAIKQKRDLDEAMVVEASTAYDSGLLELELGQEKGYTNIRGGDAVKQPLVENYRKMRDSLQESILGDLPDEDQRSAVGRRMQIADQQFDARMYRHIAEQSRAHQNTVSEGALASERQMAALNWRQPGQIEMSILRTNMEIERKARIDGLDPNTPDDKRVIDTLKTIAETQIHANVVSQMLVNGQDAAASAYYRQIKDRLSPEAIVTLGGKVESSATEGEAVRGTDLVWATMGPRSINDNPRLDIMETWLRDKYKDNPKIMEAAIKDLRSRAIAHKDGQQQFVATNKAKVLEAYHNGNSLAALQRMPEYLALDGEEKIRMRDYLVANGWTEQQRAREQAKINGYSRYLDLSNPKVLSTLSEAQIKSMEPELGQDLMGDLIRMRRGLNSPEKIRAATMDTELFNKLAADAGFNPYQTPLAPATKETLGRLRSEVESEIDAMQTQKGGLLTREEKEKTMLKILDRQVMEKGFFGDTRIPAAIVTPEQRSKIFVPMAEIDSNWMGNAINYMKSEGMIPQDMTPEKVKIAYKGRLERAYGIYMTGGTTEEGRKALEGK